jgi:two-component system nitrate/nitrite response regulator NarL
MTAPIRLAIIDDHPLFREGVTRSLSEIGGFEVVGEGGTKDDALQITEAKRPDIVLLDISMPGGGLSAIAPILDRYPTQKIVMLTVSEASDDVAKALNSGAKGYVLKGVGSRALAEILRTVASGESYVSPMLSARLLSDLSAQSGSPVKTNPIADLTSREKEILTLVAAGLSNKRVALRLDLHEKTVKHHMTRILAKLNVTNRTEAAMALRDAADNRRHAGSGVDRLVKSQ